MTCDIAPHLPQWGWLTLCGPVYGPGRKGFWDAVPVSSCHSSPLCKVTWLVWGWPFNANIASLTPFLVLLSLDPFSYFLRGGWGQNFQRILKETPVRGCSHPITCFRNIRHDLFIGLWNTENCSFCLSDNSFAQNHVGSWNLQILLYMSRHRPSPSSIRVRLWAWIRSLVQSQVSTVLLFNY